MELLIGNYSTNSEIFFQVVDDTYRKCVVCGVTIMKRKSVLDKHINSMYHKKRFLHSWALTLKKNYI